MMNILYKLTAVGLWVIFTVACVKDPGNYDYKEVTAIEPFQLEGIEDRYDAETLTRFELPDLALPQGIDSEDYEFLWYLYPESNMAGAIKSDTVCKTLKLDFLVTQASGKYVLVLQAKNKKTGICAYRKSVLDIMSGFARGWYVTKDENRVTDIDWVDLQGEVHPNVLASINGEGVTGEALKTTYMGGRYNYEQENPDGTVTLIEGQKVLFTLSRSDMRVYNSENLQLIRKFGDIFVSTPEVAAPRDAVHGFFMGSFILNNGKVHSLSTFTSPSYGKFGAEKIGDYRVADDLIRCPMGEIILFDTQSQSFCYSTVPKNTIQYFSYDPLEDKADPNRMNCDLVFMKERRFGSYCLNTCFAILKKRDKNEYYFAAIDPDATASGAHLFESYGMIPQKNEVGKAKVFGVHNISSTLYFSSGDHVLKSFNTVNFTENPEVFTFPKDEKITFIGHIDYNEYSDPSGKMECLVVLTNTTTRWKLYCFDFVGQTSDIVTTGYKEYSGNGHAASVIYRGPGAMYIN